MRLKKKNRGKGKKMKKKKKKKKDILTLLRSEKQEKWSKDAFTKREKWQFFAFPQSNSIV